MDKLWFVASEVDPKALTDCFASLDTFEQGLSTRISNYILGQGDDTVLSSLNAITLEQLEASQLWFPIDFNDLKIDRKLVFLLRSKLLVDPYVFKRFGEVFSKFMFTMRQLRPYVNFTLIDDVPSWLGSILFVLPRVLAYFSRSIVSRTLPDCYHGEWLEQIIKAHHIDLNIWLAVLLERQGGEQCVADFLDHLVASTNWTPILEDDAFVDIVQKLHYSAKIKLVNHLVASFDYRVNVNLVGMLMIDQNINVREQAKLLIYEVEREALLDYLLQHLTICSLQAKREIIQLIFLWTDKQLVLILRLLLMNEKDQSMIDFIHSLIENQQAAKRSSKTTSIFPSCSINTEDHIYIQGALGMAKRYDADVSQAITMLTTFPSIPEKYLKVLYQYALSLSDEYSMLARKAIEHHGIDLPRVIKALTAKQPEERMAATFWIKRLKSTQATQALAVSLANERDYEVKNMMLLTLLHLGYDISEFISKLTLLQEAREGLDAPIPKRIRTFPFNDIPKLIWKNGEHVFPQVIAWWILLAFQLKKPQGYPLLDLYLQQLDVDSQKRLGAFILKTYIDSDIHNAAKGILSLMGKADGAQVAQMITQYMQKSDQQYSRLDILLTAIARSNEPAIIQLVYTISQNCRKNSIKNKANDIFRAMAERNNFTQTELADQVVSTAGFKENGEQNLSLSSTQLTIKLQSDFKLNIQNDKGISFEHLLADELHFSSAHIKKAKNAISTIEDELNQIIDLQKTRLYAAMCTGRTWHFSVWKKHFLHHPIMRKVAQSLVLYLHDHNQQRFFSPNEDLTITHFDGRVYQPNNNALISLAYANILDANMGKAWLEYFKLNNIKPLFDQFSRATYVLSEYERSEYSINYHQNRVIKGHTLRNILTKRGYQSEDLDCDVYLYQCCKNYTDINLKVVIDFSPYDIRDKQAQVALEGVQFKKYDDSTLTGEWHLMKMSEIPSSLANATLLDYEAIAAKGSLDPSCNFNCKI